MESITRKADIYSDYFLFPYDKVEKGSKIILYAAGDIGKILFQQIFSIQYCEVIAFADIAAESIHFNPNLPICILPQNIPEYNFDYIVIAKLSKSIAIKEDLINLGVDPKKIILLDNHNFIPISLKHFDSYLSSNIQEMDGLLQAYQENISQEEIYKKYKEIIVYKNIVKSSENLLSWFPFDTKSNVLELNAQCGTLTRLLCKKTQHVTAIIPDIWNYKINKIRNQNYTNLELLHNFSEINKSAVYDYVIFENINDEFLSIGLESVYKFLKPEATVIVTGKNKFGLSNWAKIADGLYENKSLDGIERKNFFNQYQIYFPNHRCVEYYPFPNAITPEFIFTEKYLPRLGDIRMNQYIHFNLDIAYDAMSFTNTYKEIVDSFCFILEPQSSKREKLLFTNFKSVRKEKFCISTRIIEEANEKLVIKKAIFKSARNHVFSLLEKREKLKMVYYDFEFVNVWKYSEDEIAFPFIEGESLDHYLWKVHNQPELVFQILKDYIFRMEHINADYLEQTFVASEEFKAIFGDPGNYIEPAVFYGNLDCHFDNIKIYQNKYYCFDYEWVFPFAVPLRFTIYRSIDIFFKKYSKYLDPLIYGENFWIQLGFQPEELSLFIRFNRNLWVYLSYLDPSKINFEK